MSLVQDRVVHVFDTFQSGKGIENHLLQDPYVADGCTFECKAFPDQRKFEDHILYLHDLVQGPIPDLSHKIVSITSNESQVTVVGTISGHHTGTGGPVRPSSPPKSASADFSMTFTVDEEGRVVHVFKVFDVSSFQKELGW